MQFLSRTQRRTLRQQRRPVAVGALPSTPSKSHSSEEGEGVSEATKYVHEGNELVRREPDGGEYRLRLPDPRGFTVGYWIKPSPFDGTPPWEWVITNVDVLAVTGMSAGYTHTRDSAVTAVRQALHFWASLGYDVVEPEPGMDVSESDRALVVAEQRLDRVRECAERWRALELDPWVECDCGRCVKQEFAEFADVILAILDSDDTPKCRECSCEGFQLSPRGLCDGCEEYVSFNERNDTDDTTKGGR
jgi:hypothetical protein